MKENGLDRPKRVFYVEEGIGFGGSVVSLAEMIKGLHSAVGIETIVLTYQEAEVIRGLFPSAIVLHYKRRVSYRGRLRLSNFLRKNVFLSFFEVGALKVYALLDVLYGLYLSVIMFRTIKRYDIDIVHANNAWQHELIRAAHWAKIPCYMHLRGWASTEFQRIIRKNKRMVDTTIKKGISISDYVAKLFIKYGFPEDKMTVVYNPVDLSIYDRAKEYRSQVRKEYSIDDNTLVAGFFGRMTRWKGVLEFLKAAELVVKECPNMKFMVVGDSSDSEDAAYAKELEAISNSSRLSDRVIFTGFQRNVQNYYSAVDIVVHSSIAPEPFGRVVIEGMASAKAVIAMNDGGPTEIVTHGVDGLLVKPGDVDQLGRALIRLCDDQSLRLKLGENARIVVERRFKTEKIGKQIADIYLGRESTMEEV